MKCILLGANTARAGNTASETAPELWSSLGYELGAVFSPVPATEVFLATALHKWDRRVSHTRNRRTGKGKPDLGCLEEGNYL